jgi:hypothetical protein
LNYLMAQHIVPPLSDLGKLDSSEVLDSKVGI